MLGGLGDGEPGVGLEGVGELAVAVALEGFVLGLEGGVELVLALAPELVVDGQLGGALAEGGHVLVIGRVGRAADGDVGNLCGKVHNHYYYRLLFSESVVGGVVSVQYR